MVRHSVTAEVIVVTSDFPRLVRDDPSLAPMVGETLEALRKRLGGDEGYLEVPGRDEKVLVSLNPWRDAPPDKRFVLSFRFTPEKPFRIRRPAAEMLIGALPVRSEDAATLEELLDRQVSGWTETRLPDGSFQRRPSTYTAREELAKVRRPPTRGTLVRGLGDLVSGGDIARVGSGTRGNPYRYWMDPFARGSVVAKRQKSGTRRLDC